MYRGNWDTLCFEVVEVPLMSKKELVKYYLNMFAGLASTIVLNPESDILKHILFLEVCAFLCQVIFLNVSS